MPRAVMEARLGSGSQTVRAGPFLRRSFASSRDRCGSQIPISNRRRADRSCRRVRSRGPVRAPSELRGPAWPPPVRDGHAAEGLEAREAQVDGMRVGYPLEAPARSEASRESLQAVRAVLRPREEPPQEPPPSLRVASSMGRRWWMAERPPKAKTVRRPPVELPGRPVPLAELLPLRSEGWARSCRDLHSRWAPPRLGQPSSGPQSPEPLARSCLRPLSSVPPHRVRVDPDPRIQRLRPRTLRQTRHRRRTTVNGWVSCIGA